MGQICVFPREAKHTVTLLSKQSQSFIRQDLQCAGSLWQPQTQLMHWAPEIHQIPHLL